MKYVRRCGQFSNASTITTKLVALALVFFSSVNAFATLPVTNGAPQTIAFQGYLTDTSGNPVTSATKLRFCLFKNANRLWCGEYTNVTMNNGLFSVELGSSAQGGAVL